MKIALLGFMGTGKSEVGKILSQLLQFRLIDTDKEIVRRTGMEIPALFKVKGEEYFRKQETEVLEEILQIDQNLVISTGGGIVITSYNRKLLKDYTLPVLLQASPEVIYERVKDSDRPLLQVDDPLKEIKRLLKDRSLYYNNFGTVVNTDYREPEEIAREIVKRIKQIYGLDKKGGK